MDECSFPLTVLGQEYQCFYINSIETSISILNKLDNKNCLFGLDTETEPLPQYRNIKTAGLSPHLAKIRLLQISDGVNSFVFDLKFIEDSSIFLPFLESKKFIAHNALFDLQFLRKLGVRNINIGCTYILAKLLFHAVYPTDEGLSASLDALCKDLLGLDIVKALQVSDWTIPNLTFEQVEYAALDSICVLKLAEKLAPGMSKFNLERIYKLSKEAQHPIASLQLNGLKLDVERHKKMIDVWRTELYTAKKEVLSLTGLRELTAYAVAHWLEENLEPNILAIWPRTATGKLGTDSHTLAEFSYLPIVQPFSTFQKKEKLTSSFGYSLLNHINSETKRLHSSYNICGARTGRLSSSKPNLQQLPRDADVRKNFIPEPGKVYVCADFSQIELRVAAELSRDANMLNAYAEGIDLHALTASAVSGKALGEVTKEERQFAKSLNFGLLFGLGAKKFSHYAKTSYGVEVTDEEAHESVQIFRETYAGYREWQLEQANIGGTTFEVRTPCGKLRRLPEDSTFGNSMNHPVQGGAAEVMLHALIRLDEAFPFGGEVKLVNCVHDEILIETPFQFKEDVKQITEECMRFGFLDVFPEGVSRGLVDAGIGDSWGDAK